MGPYSCRSSPHAPCREMLPMARVLALLAVTMLCAPTQAGSTTSVIPGTSWTLRKPDSPSHAEVDLAPYGQPEERGAYPQGGLLLAVRFDPPFPAPYEITTVSFPSFTSSGAAAVFESVSLCELDPISGLVKFGAPIVTITPFVGSADGWNEIAVNSTVHDPGRILFLCFAFPTSGAVEDRPMLRWDIQTTELGEFGASYSVHPSGRLIGTSSGNFVSRMRCRLPVPEWLPLEASQGFGASRVQGGIEFSFTPSRNIRTDSSASMPDGLDRTDLLARTNSGPWRVVACGRRDADRIQLDISEWDSLSDAGFVHYAAQSVSRRGIRSIPSNVVWVPIRGFQLFADDEIHPNGLPWEATPIEPCRASCTSVDAALFPAGDRDFWSFEAVPGELLRAVFIPSYSDHNQVTPTMELYDSRERLVARSEGAFQLDYAVSTRHGKVGSRGKYLLLVRDGLTTPGGAPAPRLLNPPWYNIRIEGSGGAIGAELVRPRLGVSRLQDGTVRFLYEALSIAQEQARAQVFDVHGRLVRTLRDTERNGSMTWDLKDEAGLPVRSGIYFARLQVGQASAVRKIALISPASR